MPSRQTIKSDNKGSAVVTVLIAIVFLSILGAILMFTSYTGYRIKASQAVGENRFYDAETAMNEIRAGVQGIVSDSIAEAYNYVLTFYTGDISINHEFIMAFKYDFLSADDLFELSTGVTITDTEIDNLFGIGPSAGYGGETVTFTDGLNFDIDFLYSFVTDKAHAVLDINGTDNSVVIQGIWVRPVPSAPYEFNVTSITIRNLRITHITDDQYMSVVESDLVIDVPSLSYASSLFSFRDLSEYAFIATGELRTAGGTADISGNAFVGSANLTQAGSVLRLNRGTFISGGRAHFDPEYTVNGALREDINGDITVAGRLFADSGVTIWANNIRVGNRVGNISNSGSVELTGFTYAAGSLIFEGISSEAILEGEFIGFGNDMANPAYSSSIIVNSRRNRLDMEDLRRLWIAGHSFITYQPESPLSRIDVFTGQSLAIRSDQLAYLIPASLIENQATNPFVYLGSWGLPVLEIDFDAPLWGTANTLRDYGIESINDVQPINRPIHGSDDQYMYYAFMRFKDIQNGSGTVIETASEAASRYFRDYFTNNPEDIRDYTDLYLTYFRASSHPDIHGSGAIYTGEVNTGTGTDTLDVINGPAPPDNDLIESYQNGYDSRRRTLTPAAPALGSINYPINAPYPENPFYYTVLNEPSLPPAGSYEFGGKVLAYVHNTGGGAPLSLQALHNDPDNDIDVGDLRIIICYGDINVNMDFTGIILCDGDIILDRHIENGNTNDLRDALRAVNSSIPVTLPNRIGDYLIADMQEVDSGESSSSSWNFAELVRYDNWKKS